MEPTLATIFRLRDISPETLPSQWPYHLIKLIAGFPLDDRKLRIDELVVFLCHTALVELGFVPTFVETDLETILQSKDRDRISILSHEIPENLRNSSAGVFTISYRGIKETLVHIPNESDPAAPPRNEYRYEFSSSADVVFIAQNLMVSIYGSVKGESPNKVPASVSMQLNIMDYLRIRESDPPRNSIDVLREDHTGQEWLNLIQLRGASFTETIKADFGRELLTLVDGMPFEAGLLDVPPEVLFRLLKYLNIRTIVNVSKTCSYLYGATESNFFWLSLIDRDFPQHSKEVRTNLTNPPPATTISEPTPEAPSAYSEYRRLYLAVIAQRPRRFGSVWEFSRRYPIIRFPPQVPSRRSMFLFR